MVIVFILKNVPVLHTHTHTLKTHIHTHTHTHTHRVIQENNIKLPDC